MLEEFLYGVGQRLPATGRARRHGALDLRPAQVELIMQRASLVGANGGVIEVARGGTRHIEDELPHDLVVDRRFGRGHRCGDALVELLGGEPLALVRGELDVPWPLRDRRRGDPGRWQVRKKISFPRPAAMALFLP